MIKRIYLICLVFFVTASVQATEPTQAGIATAHPLATQAGMEILAAGGNAFDAAVAVSATLAVVEPMSSGLGGGGFWLIYRASDQHTTMVDGREKAPQGAHRNVYLDTNGTVIERLSIDGPMAAAIPGTPAALAYISDKFGKLPLKVNLAPAIKYARNGFKVYARYQRLAKFRKPALLQSPAATSIFLLDNEVPNLDTVIKQPDLASTLQTLATQGKPGFYAGAIAKKLVDGVNQAGGIWTYQDLSNYRVVERQPVQGEYRGLLITTAPPPSSGGIALISALNILAGYDLPQENSVTRKHLIIEAMRRAYRDRAIYLGDPDFVDIPSERLIHPFYAAGLRASIRKDQATASENLPGVMDQGSGHHTTHFSIIDKQGNRVAATLSVNYPFGSGFMPPGTGVLLNDEMDDFSAKPLTPNAYGLVGGEANAIAPNKRPLSSMSPTFLENDSDVVILGTPGGSRIISMVLLAILDFAEGGTPQTMVSLPRFHHQYLPDVVQHEENTFSNNELDELSLLGHQFKKLNAQYGNMQVVQWNKRSNQVFAGSDPRAEGLAEVK